MPPLTAVVTGANKGIGLEIARQLAQHSGTRTVLTARAADRGQAAAAEVKLGAAAGSEVLFHPLDITDAASIQRFAAWAQAELQQVDVLVNNAGMAYKGNTFGAEEAAATIATNFYGTAAVCEALLGGGLIPGGGRIINVGSSAGKLSIVRDPALRSKFEAAASKAELAQLADGFVDAIRRGRHSQEGWPSSMYGISKLAENQYSRVLAAELAPRRIAVAAVCPGYCATDMSSWRGTQSAAQGADTPVWLALLPASENEAITGRFWSGRREEPF